MPDVFDLPTERIAALCDTTERALRTLIRALALDAARQPGAAVPHSTLRLAATLLSDARRVLSRQGRVASLLRMPDTPTTPAELLPHLALARDALAAYREAYTLHHPDGDEWEVR